LDTGLALRTKRLLLREFKEKDWEAVQVYASDSEVVKYMPWGPNSEEDTKNFIQTAISFQTEKPRKRYELAAVLKYDDTLVGGCGLGVSSPENREGVIGYCFNSLYWNAGLATEAAEALVVFGFEQLGLHRIWASCDTENRASSRVLEKVGMKKEAQLRENVWIRGKWRDSVIYAVLDREWAEVREKVQAPRRKERGAGVT
jgi:ribosomal-protein-alanine N-acetyltransferase